LHNHETKQKEEEEEEQQQQFVSLRNHLTTQANEVLTCTICVFIVILMVNLKNIKTMEDTIFFTHGEEETSKSLVHHPSKHSYSKHDILTFFGLQDHHVDDIGHDEIDVHVT